MTPRMAMIITLALASHVFLAVPLVTSQLPPERPAAAASVAEADAAANIVSFAGTEERPPLAGRITGSASLPSDEVVIRARQQEKIGDIYKLDGDVEITYRRYTVRAQHVTYDSSTGVVEAEGGVTFDGGPRDEHLVASRGRYNIHSQSGTFYDVVGMIGAVHRGRNVVLTTSNPFMLTGKRVDKEGQRYVVHRGTITSCTLPHPKWNFDAERIDVVAGEEAKIYHSSFHLFGLPVFYFPYVKHSVDQMGRHSGFLLPVIGQSNTRGLILGEGFFWAINRSMDLSAGAEYFSKRGWSQTGSFRAKPSETSNFEMRYFGVLDRGDPRTGQDQSGQDVKLNGEWQRDGWRAVTSINYLSSFLFRLAWAPTFTQAIDSEVRSTLFVSKNFSGYSFGMLASRYQNFQSINTGDEIKIVHAPSFAFSSVDRRLLSTPVTWGFDTSAEGVSRTEPDFRTSTLVGRYDLRPRAALPLHWKDWSLRPEVAVRETYYTERVQPSLSTGVGTPLEPNLNRKAMELSVEMRPPALARIFDREFLGREIKHVIEPRVTYTRVAGVNNFGNIIRFDAADILSDTNEVEFGLVNRIYGRRRLPRVEAGCEAQPSKPVLGGKLAPGKALAEPLPGTAVSPRKCEDQGSTTREMLSWEVKMKHFFDPYFGNAIVNGQRNVVTSSVEFAGIAFLTAPRQWSPVVSKVRTQPTANTDLQWEFDYDSVRGNINSSTVLADYRFGDIFVGGSHAFFRVPGEILAADASGITPPPDFNQFRVLLGYGNPNKRGLNTGVSFGMDMHFEYLQYAAAQMSYNWDCCGFSFEYRRFTLGSTTIGSVRNENQFRFTLTLANIGSFGNLRRQERLF